MYIFYILITLVILLLFFLVKDKRKLLGKFGTTSIVSSIVLIIIGFIINIIFPLFISFNTSKITNIILKKFLFISLFFLIIGLVLLVLSKILNRSKQKKSPS